MRKKRLPIEQLREAGKIARQMLVDRGILAKESLLDNLLKGKNAPKLPGIPVYLPHQWTLQASQRMMYDLLVIWKIECKGDNEMTENLTEFFKFVVKELRKKERKFDKEVKENRSKFSKEIDEVPVLKDVFSPLRKKEGMRAMNRFFVDSFAVSIALKNINSVSEYADWFLDWTQELYAIWVKPEKNEAKKDNKV